MYLLQNYRTPRQPDKVFGVVAMQCQYDLIAEIAADSKSPFDPYPGGKYSCYSFVFPYAIFIYLVPNSAGWSMTYLQISTILVDVWDAVTDYNDLLPTFDFDVRLPSGSKSLLAKGTWAPARRDEQATNTTSGLYGKNTTAVNLPSDVSD